MRASTPSDQVAGGKAPGDGLHERHVLAGRLTVTCPPGEATAARSAGQVLPGAGLRLRRVMRACPAPDRRLTGGPARGGGAAAEPRRRAQDAPKQWRGKFLKYKEHKKQIKAYKDECARPARRLAPRCAPGELPRHRECADRAAAGGAAWWPSSRPAGRPATARRTTRAWQTRSSTSCSST